MLRRIPQLTIANDTEPKYRKDAEHCAAGPQASSDQHLGVSPAGRRTGIPTAAAAAAPTPDDDESSTKSEVKKQADAETVREKEPPNQIVGLLNALLSLGQLEHALFILGLFPWLLGAFEAGLFPGVTYYLSWYVSCPRAFHLRTAAQYLT